MHSPQQYSYIYTFLNWQAFKHWNFIMSHLQHLTQCMHSPLQYSYIYFPELASLQTLKLHHVTLTTFDPVYTHFPQQYSYIYTFLNWQAFKHWNFIMLHLQHFTQCMHSPQQYSYIYTFLNWQAFKHWNFIMLHLQHVTQCTHSPLQYSYIYFPELASLQTLKLHCVTLTTFYPVYMHSPHHCSMASLQNYEHFHTLWINLQNITNNFKTYTLECVIHLTFLNNPKNKHFRSICKVLMPQQIFISVKMFTKFHGSLKLTFVDVHFNDPNSHFQMSLKITQTNIY